MSVAVLIATECGGKLDELVDKLNVYIKEYLSQRKCTINFSLKECAEHKQGKRQASSSDAVVEGYLEGEGALEQSSDIDTVVRNFLEQISTELEISVEVHDIVVEDATNAPEQEEDGGLGPGAIAGIVIGVLAAVGLIVALAFWYVQKKNDHTDYV